MTTYSTMVVYYAIAVLYLLSMFGAWLASVAYGPVSEMRDHPLFPLVMKVMVVFPVLNTIVSVLFIYEVIKRFIVERIVVYKAMRKAHRVMKKHGLEKEWQDILQKARRQRKAYEETNSLPNEEEVDDEG